MNAIFLPTSTSINQKSVPRELVVDGEQLESLITIHGGAWLLDV